MSGLQHSENQGRHQVNNPEAALASNPQLKAQFEAWLKNPSASAVPTVATTANPTVSPALVPAINPKQNIPQVNINGPAGKNVH